MKPPIIDLEAWSPSLNDWKLKRDSFREGLRNRLGHLPMLPREIHATCQREEAHGVGVAEKIVIDNGREMGIPAWFITPRNEEHPGPAVLWLHWHGGEYGVGKQEVFEDLHTPSSPAQTFLQMGWSILCMDAFGFGERNGRDPESGGDFDQEGEHTLAKHFLWQGSSLFGQMLWEDRLALRYLKQRPEVRGQPIFVAGVSMGATRSQWLLALEDVLAGAVSLACAVRYRDLLAKQGLHRHGMYFYVPGMMEYCDFELILAPRRVRIFSSTEPATHFHLERHRSCRGPGPYRLCPSWQGREPEIAIVRQSRPPSSRGHVERDETLVRFCAKAPPAARRSLSLPWAEWTT